MLSRRIVMFGCLVLVGSGCGKTQSSETENIFGPDNREAPTNAAPYTAIGRLDSGCTGTLISKRLVLTAAHCIVDSKTGTVKPEVKYFQPNMRNGKSSDPSWIEFAWIGTNQPETLRSSDWAIVRLADEVSATYGSIAVHATDFAAAALPYTISLIGYSSDKDSGGTATMHRGCYVHKVLDGKLFHDCDATAGSSGGPILETINGNTYIVGVSVSEYRQGANGSVTRDQYSEDYTNVAVPASTFAATATQIIKNVGAGSSVPAFDGVLEMVNPNTRPNQGDQNDPDQNDPDQDPDQNDPQPNKPDQDDPQPNKPDQDDPQPNKPDQDDPQPNKPDQDDPQPNKPDQDDPDPNDQVQDTPEPSTFEYVDPRLLMRREALVKETMGAMGNVARFVRSIGYGTADVKLLEEGDDLIAACRSFNLSMMAFVNTFGEQFKDVQAAHGLLMQQVQLLEVYDPAALPSRAAADLERARADTREITERLNGLILN